MLFFLLLLAAARRLLCAWGSLQTHPDDVVWPGLHDYPYGPPPR